MSVKQFLFTLENKINLKYPDLQPQFYISQRSRNIHMGLNRSLLSVRNTQDIVSEIYEHYNSNSWNFNIRFVYPTLINTTKWKFDYITLKKPIR